ncbi:MAG: hypothetical protein IKI68_00120, partial [Clostridia bacterium]|nr:hypothetical protein [Clostridia bacterium]
AISKINIGTAKAGMKDFETLTAYVTAPDSHAFYTGGKEPEFYTRTMAIGAEFSDGVSIDFDDIKIESIGRENVAMTFAVPSKKTQSVVIGKPGAKITFPDSKVDRNTYVEGWYTDKEFTKPFTLKTFPKNNMTVYGNTADSKVRYYGFTDYPWDSTPNEKNHRAIGVNHSIKKGISSDGDGYALRIDNTYDGATEAQQTVCLPIKIKPSTKYLISYDFYYEKIGDRTSAWSTVFFNTSVSGEPWQGTQLNITNTDEYTPAALEEGKWMTGYVYGTTTEWSWSNSLVLLFNVPIGSVRYIDNLVITEVSENECIAMYKLGNFQSPKPTIARKNTTITLPKVNLSGNYVFLNWLYRNDDYKESTFVLEEDTVFNGKTTVKSVKEGFEETVYGDRGLSSYGFDPDWEIYDSSGKDASKVKSGRYSLHRVGKDPRNTAYCIHFNAPVTKYSLAVGQVYTASFWVKVENPVHTLGSVDLASCISLSNPWDLSSDRFNVAAIADIADGQWHEVSYTFMSSGDYLTLIVPGNLSIYIDDIDIEYTPDAERSENCTFEEYIPALLTADGKYIKPLSDVKDKFQLVKRTDDTLAAASGNNDMTLLIVIIASSLLVIAGGITGAVLLMRKKRKGGDISGTK